MCLETDKVQDASVDIFRAMILEEVLKFNNKELFLRPARVQPLFEMGIIQRPA